MCAKRLRRDVYLGTISDGDAYMMRRGDIRAFSVVQLLSGLFFG